MKSLAIILAGCIGFLSLSEEILWVRVVSFSHQGLPQSFSLVLGLFLLGIAAGAEIGKRICKRSDDLITASAYILLLTAVVDVSIVLSLSKLIVGPSSFSVLLIIASALSKSTLFPIVHHLGSKSTGTGLGVSVSLVYFSNIVGSTLGPLLTGFVVLDHMGLRQAFVAICLADLVLAIVCFIVVRFWTAMSLSLVTMPLLVFLFVHNSTLMPAKRVLQNRQGIIHVLNGGDMGDIIFGGNVYDGRFNTDLKKNSNIIERVYILAALHPAPKRILVIGLSGGAWTKVLSGLNNVDQIDVVEINPGYLELIQTYPEVSDILLNPKIHIHIDDGRRWLKRHPQNKYDLVVMNTTFYWRNYASNLLAVEFLRLIHRQMNEGAILTFNTTGSMDAFKTASVVFRHAYLYTNCVVAGDHDFRSNLTGGFDRIAKMTWNTIPIFNLKNKKDVEAIRRVLAIPFIPFYEIQQSSARQYEVITEQNMITEYKFGRKMF